MGAGQAAQKDQFNITKLDPYLIQGWVALDPSFIQDAYTIIDESS